MSTQPVNPTPDPTQTVHMFDPDGTAVHAVPFAQAHDALASGGKPALQFQAPDGSMKYVPADKTQDAISAGGKLVPYQQQPDGIKAFYGFTPANMASNLWQGVKGIVGGSYDVAKDLVTNPNWVQGKDSTAAKFIEKPSNDQVQKASEALQAGNRSAAAGHILASAVPLIGPWAAGLGEQAGTGDIGGAVGQAAGTVLGGEAVAKGAQVAKAGASLGVEPLARGAVEVPGAIKDALAGSPIRAAQNIVKGVAEPAILKGTPEDIMTRAVKPTASNTGWDTAIKTAMPDLKNAESAIGRPVQGIDDALQAVSTAKKQVWGEYQDQLTKANAALPAQGNLFDPAVDGGKIADAMEASVTPRQAQLNPGLADKVKASAATYRRPMSLDETESFLQDANNELQGYYARNKVGQKAALADPTMAATVAEAGALRESLYSKITELTGEDPTDPKSRYGALSNVENELLRRKNVAARQQPLSLQEQISGPMAAGKIAGGLYSAATGRVGEGMTMAREGATQLVVSKALKDIMTTDNMVKSAFENYGPSSSSSLPTTLGTAAGKAIKTLSGTRGEAGSPGSVSELDDKLAKVNNTIRANDDNALFKQARTELGASASYSDVASRAQELKAQGLAMRRTPADTMQDVREAAAKDPNLAGLDAATRARAVEMRQKYPVKAGSLSAKALKDFYANR